MTVDYTLTLVSAGAAADGDFDDDDTEGKGMSDKRYTTRMHEVLGVDK